jgi:hypothetical protein
LSLQPDTGKRVKKKEKNPKKDVSIQEIMMGTVLDGYVEARRVKTLSEFTQIVDE